MNETSLFDVLFAVAAVVGALATIFGFIAAFSSTLRAAFLGTVGRRARWYRVLARLVPDAQVEYFESLLGAAVYRNVRDDGLTETVFVNRFFYVQCLSEESGRVLLYSVTARKRGFRPVLWGANPNSTTASARAKLGEFTFDQLELTESPCGLVAWLGANRFHYAESYYFGNPGLYLTYLLAINQAGFLDDETLGAISLLGGREEHGWFRGESDWPGGRLEQRLTEPPFPEFRKQARPNTYAVVSQHKGYGDLAFIGEVGANVTQVRSAPF